MAPRSLLIQYDGIALGTCVDQYPYGGDSVPPIFGTFVSDSPDGDESEFDSSKVTSYCH
jgi:hypothetical protein